jgi:hypothetical protein
MACDIFRRHLPKLCLAAGAFFGKGGAKVKGLSGIASEHCIRLQKS